MTLDTAFIGVGALAVFLWWRWCIKSGPQRARLPPELRNACLVHAERLFRSTGPVSISARVDRVYRKAAGALVLVELKTRNENRTYPSDVIELSAQRLALMAQTGKLVANHAYVMTERPDGGRAGCHRVVLMSQADVMQLATRRQELLAGAAEPLLTCLPGLCQKCGFVRLCEVTFPRTGKLRGWV